MVCVNLCEYTHARERSKPCAFLNKEQCLKLPRYCLKSSLGVGLNNFRYKNPTRGSRVPNHAGSVLVNTMSEAEAMT